VDEFFCDIESFSVVDLKKHGLMRYARDESTEIMMMSYAWNNAPVHRWEAHRDGPLPQQIREILLEPSVRKIAFNSQFENTMLREVLGIDSPIEQWR
jgi:DNA polymerase